MEPYVATAETHTGAVLFLDDLAYKVKKPVSLGFVEWTDRSARATAVQRELELNRRLSPDVYLGTTELPRPGAEGEPALVMRRLPATRRLSTLVRQGADVDEVLRKIAHQLATLHASSEPSPAAADAACADEIGRRWQRNHDRMLPLIRRDTDRSLAIQTIEMARRYVDGRGDLFDQRVRHGWARDGHGDLLTDDVFCLDDGPRILDCLDFDDALRTGDVLADAAFLAMDLERLGRADLGWRFLRFHRELLADHWPTSLAHHYISYRAQIRALVSVVRAGQGDPGAVDEASLHLAVASTNGADAQPRLVLVGGAPGTGKSTLSAALGEQLGAVVLRSDQVRKELAGIPSATSARSPQGTGIYTDAWSGRTYAELLERAARLLAGGEHVILDASWAEEGQRAAARDLARTHLADVDELRCTVSPTVARARAEDRARRGGDPSDADGDLAVTLAHRQEPWPGARQVDTEGAPEASLAAAAAALGIRRT